MRTRVFFLSRRYKAGAPPKYAVTLRHDTFEAVSDKEMVVCTGHLGLFKWHKVDSTVLCVAPTGDADVLKQRLEHVATFRDRLNFQYSLSANSKNHMNVRLFNCETGDETDTFFNGDHIGFRAELLAPPGAKSGERRL